MAGNIINIKFNEDINLTGTVVLSSQITGFGLPQNFQDVWEWVTLRTQAFKVTKNLATEIPGERTAIDFAQAFQLDKNNSNQYSVSRSGTTVIITALTTNTYGITFDQLLAYKTGNTPASVTVTYGTINTSTLEFTSLTFTPYAVSGLRCRNVQVRITTNQNVTQIISPINEPLSSNLFGFPYARSSSGIVTVNNGLGQTISQSFKTPDILIPANYTITVNGSPYGGTAIVSFTNQYLITQSYALIQGSTTGAFQSSPVFSSLTPGNYTLLIKDQYGCNATKDFTVTAFQSTRVPEFYISKSMSIRFAFRERWNYSTIYKTDENTLSCEVDVPMPYKEIQQFQTLDSVTTQFKSNYSLNKAFIVRNGLADVEIPVIKRSQNIGVKARMQSMVYNMGMGKNGMYFITGDVYDYDTNVKTGEYTLNGALPIWAVIGNYIGFNGGWFIIEDIIYNEDIAADVIVFSGGYSGVDMLANVKTIFNLFEYEVYEFDINFSEYPNQDLKVRIDCTDTDFDPVSLISEKINVKDRQINTIALKYSNPENTDVFYSTGIVNMLRIPLAYKNAQADQQSEILKGDRNTVLLESTVYEMDKVEFLPVTKEILRKITEALNHKNIALDGTGYVLNGNVEIDERLGVTNLYVLRATLIKTDNPFTSKPSGDNLFNPLYADIPGLINDGNGNFIEYKS